MVWYGEEYGEANVYGCVPTNGTSALFWWKFYNINLTIVQYFVPLFLFDGAYCFIAYKVRLPLDLHLSVDAHFSCRTEDTCS